MLRDLAMARTTRVPGVSPINAPHPNEKVFLTRYERTHLSSFVAVSSITSAMGWAYEYEVRDPHLLCCAGTMRQVDGAYVSFVRYYMRGSVRSPHAARATKRNYVQRTLRKHYTVPCIMSARKRPNLLSCETPAAAPAAQHQPPR